MFKKYWEKIKQVAGLIAVIYPALQILLKSQGVDLPDLGPEFGAVAQVGGAGLLAKSEKIGKKKPSAPYVFNT